MNQPEINLPTAESQPEVGGADAGRMFQILWRGKWILLSIPILAFLAAKYWLGNQTQIFMAMAQVQVDARQVNVLKSGAGEAINKPRTVLKQQQSLLKSTPILRRIVESPAVQGLAMFSPARLGGKNIMGALYESMQTSIDVESDRLFVTCTSPSRQDAIVVVDEALRVYIEYHKEKKRERAQGLAEIVRTEWEAAKAELDEASAGIATLQSENSLLAGMDRTPLQTRLDDAHTALSAAHKDTQLKRAYFDDMREASKDPERFLERGRYWRSKLQINSLEERIGSFKALREEREAELRRMLRNFGSEYSRLGELRREIADLRLSEEEVIAEYAREYLRNTDFDYNSARLYEESLEKDVQGYLDQVADQNVVLDRIKDLQIERDHLRERVATFDERMAQLELENQTGALNLDILEFARAGVRPVYPETDKTMIYAVAGGGILAFALVLLLGLADRRVRQVEDVPALLGTSVLGVVPKVPDTWDRVKVARMVEEVPDSTGAEAFRSARTATTFALPNGRGVVVVTSASRGEGKSVCASNLAFALAQTGRKTLLIDADMRSPGQHLIYSVDNDIGLAQLLTTSVATKRVISTRVATGLDLLPAGDADGKGAELCEGRVLPELVASLRDTYECIVIDSSPVLETSEARVLATLADAVIFVLRLEVSKAPTLKRALGILRGVGARILGCIPNGASSQRGVRAFTGGINYGGGPVAGNDARRPGGKGEDEAQEEGRARGTDFLGLEEESA